MTNNILCSRVHVFLLTVLFSCSAGTGSRQVYVCDSYNAERYHLKADCAGLRNCRHRIIEVSEATAQSNGRTLCKWER